MKTGDGLGLALPEFPGGSLDSSSNTGVDFDSVQALVERLGLPVKNLSLFARAFTHRSFVNEQASGAMEDNERLEFLGDAVLDFVVGAWVYNHFPEMAEGELTRLALRAGPHRLNWLPSHVAWTLGLSFVSDAGNWLQADVSAITCLCGAFEAFIGALYLETDIQTAAQFIEPLLESTREQIFAMPDLADNKSRLQEWTQGQKLGALAYALIESTRPGPLTHFRSGSPREVEKPLAADGFQQSCRGAGSGKSRPGYPGNRIIITGSLLITHASSPKIP